MLVVDLDFVIDCIIFIMCTMLYVVCFFLNPSLFLFCDLFFSEFMKCVCGLKWMCCGGDVA